MLQVKNISFGYQEKTVLKNVSFLVEPGEHVSIIGESGSGKTTLLKLLYGEYNLNKGHILWKNNKILGPKYNLIAGQDYIKYVAQEFDLMPFKTVEENVGEFLSNFFLEEKKKRVNELLKVVEMKPFSKTKVHLLSGGQKQRVALARAIAKQPEIMLLDEPFSHIDNFRKQSLRRQLFSYLKSNNIACVVATHDKDDVLAYSDKIIVLSSGKIIASDSPEKLYANPKNQLIGSFFGEYNVFKILEIDMLSDKDVEEIVYAHQIKILKNSSLKAIVKNSYFNGKYFLIEALFNNRLIFIEYHKSLKKEKTICFKVIK